MRNFNRKHNELRIIDIQENINKNADGSCLISFGGTKVLCTAIIEDSVPKWLKGQSSGWVTAEYSMLPAATQTRTNREAKTGKQSGRTMEIQRLIGRSIRSVIDLKKMPEKQILIDCDVIQADGGTRTTSINGAFIALCIAVNKGIKTKRLIVNPVNDKVAAISCGIMSNETFLDLDYNEDSTAIADANFVFSEKSGIVEIQVSGEKRPIHRDEFELMYSYAEKGIKEIFNVQSRFFENEK
jgi:ribonuclease PH